MLAPALYKRTRKIAVFVPTYASKKLKTLTFGEGVRIQPRRPVNEEKLRIVNALQTGIEAMVAAEQEPAANAAVQETKEP